MLISHVLDRRTRTRLPAYALACFTLLLATSTRAEDLAAQKEPPSRWSRIPATWAVSAGGVTLSYLLAGLMIHSEPNCAKKEDAGDSLGCGIDKVARAAWTFGLTEPALLSASFFPHHALGGKGRWWTGLLGSLLGEGVIAGSTLATASSGHRTFVAGYTAGGLIASVLPVLFLELDHGRRRGSVAASRSSARFTATAVPISHGLHLRVSARL